MCTSWEGTNTVFRVDPASGRIFFGQPNEDLSGPLTGFMYEPGNESEPAGISTKDKNFFITADGRMVANNGIFNGSVNAEEATCYGKFETVSFSCEAGDEGSTTLPVSSGAEQQYSMLQLYYAAIAGRTVSFSLDSSVTRIVQGVEAVSIINNSPYIDFNFSFLDSAGNTKGKVYRKTSSGFWGSINYSYHSTWADKSFSLSYPTGGNKFFFKNLPTAIDNMQDYQVGVWDGGGGMGILFMKMPVTEA